MAINSPYPIDSSPTKGNHGGKENNNKDLACIAGTLQSDNKDVKTFEDILEDLGCFGPYQAFVLIAYLFMEIASAFVVFIPILAAKSTSTPVNCTDNYNDTFTWTTENPAVTLSPSGIIAVSMNLSVGSFTSFPKLSKTLWDEFRDVFETPFQYESLVDEWDLKCEKAWIPDVFTSLLMAGMVIGNLIWSQVADWYGRRKAYLGILYTFCGGTIVEAISPNIYFYGVARFISGSGYSGFVSVSCLAVMEFMTPKWRSLAVIAGPTGEGMIILGGLGYFIKPWRKLYLITLIPYILIIPLYFVLPESPRWLLRNKKVQEAHAVLANMAKFNGRPPISMSVLEALRKQEEITAESLKAKRISYLDFVKTRQLLKTAMFLFAAWFSWNVGYYGISYNIRNVPGNAYANLGIIGLANAIGQRVSMPASDWFGRRKAVLFGMMLAAAFLVILCICFLTLQQVSSLVILISCFIGLFGLSLVRASLRLLTGESFPTSVRAMGFAVGTLGAYIAGLLTPQTAYLGSMWPALPFFIFTVTSVIGSLVVLMMKETTGNDLVDEIDTKGEKFTLETIGNV